MEYINDRMIKPVLIGGVITGVLVFIFSYIGGCCCCVLYILSGIITAHLLTREYLPSDRDYLISGALSGGVAGFVSWLLSALISVVFIILYGTPVSYIIGDLGMGLFDFITFAIYLLISFPISLLIGAIFGTVGAIVYKIVIEEIMKK